LPAGEHPCIGGLQQAERFFERTGSGISERRSFHDFFSVEILRQASKSNDID
jgi:hypothetical protein